MGFFPSLILLLLLSSADVCQTYKALSTSPSAHNIQSAIQFTTKNESEVISNFQFWIKQSELPVLSEGAPRYFMNIET